MLGDRRHISHRLAWVLEVGQEVDDGDVAMAGELFEGPVVRHPGGEAVEQSVEDPGDVVGRLPGTHTEAGSAQHHRVATQPVHRHLGGHPGPGRGQLEEQADLATNQVPRSEATVGLRPMGHLDEIGEPIGEVADPEEIGHATPLSVPPRSATASMTAWRTSPASSLVRVRSWGRNRSRIASDRCPSGTPVPR